MLFIKRSKESVNMRLVDEIVKTYFSYLRQSNLELSCSEISELLRHSMCKLLGLESKGYTSSIEEYSKGVCNILVSLVSDNSLKNKSEDYRMGILEACVHCMEMAKNKALS